MRRAIPAILIAAIVMRKSQTDSPLRRMLIIPHLSGLPMNTIIGRSQTVGCGNVIDKAAHSGGEATCVSKAVCEVCKAQYGDVDATNHKHTEIRDARPATEQEKGYTGDTWCIDCNKKITTGSKLPCLSINLH